MQALCDGCLRACRREALERDESRWDVAVLLSVQWLEDHLAMYDAAEVRGEEHGGARSIASQAPSRQLILRDALGDGFEEVPALAPTLSDAFVQRMCGRFGPLHTFVFCVLRLRAVGLTCQSLFTEAFSFSAPFASTATC